MLQGSSASKTGLAQYQYALTGGAMLILASVAVGAAYAVPWGALDMNVEGNDMLVEYSVTHLDVEAEGVDETVSYRHDDLEGAPVQEFRAGFWLTPIAGILLFGAALAMFAAPSSSITAARGGAVAGLIGGLVLVGAIMAFGMGFSDHRDELEAEFDAQEFTYEGSTSIEAGGVFLGAGVILGLGGAMMGFSDKPQDAKPRKPAAPTQAPCPHCDVAVPAGQAFCGACGANVS